MPSKQYRDAWKAHRIKIETEKSKSNIARYYPKRNWVIFTVLLKAFGFLLRCTGLYKAGQKTAQTLVLHPIQISLSTLPRAFEGFQILHLTDFHFDRLPDLENSILKCTGSLVPDLIVFTGDYKDKMTHPASYYQAIFQKLGSQLKSKHGIYAVLGNHDTHDLVPFMEAAGIQVLLNESIEIERANTRITLTGVDDVHYFFSTQALNAIQTAPKNACKLLLVHSPEMVQEAQENDYALYLCGHTHAGQIALPNHHALVTHISRGKEFAVGKWQYKTLAGYTSSGVGVSGLTVRYFTQSEIALITLNAESSE